MNHQEKSYGATKMGELVRSRESPEIIDCLELLWKFGAYLRGPHGSMRHVIHYVVDDRRPNTLKWLLGKSIDLEARTEYGASALLHFFACNNGEHPDILEMLVDQRPDFSARDYMEEDLCHYMARMGSLAFLQVFQRRQTDLAGLDVDRRGIRGFQWEEITKGPGKTAMELVEWRRDRQPEWAIEHRMNIDPDPQVYFTAFKTWIDGIRTANLARLQTVMEANDGGRVEHNTGANQEVLQGLPGKFPDE